MRQVLKVYSKTISIISETAIEIYSRYVGDEIGFLLESYDKNYDRYVFLGKNPAAILRTSGEQLVICWRDGKKERFPGNPVQALKEYMDDFVILREDTMLPFSGGLAGAFGYDFVRWLENLPDENPDEIGIDTMQLMLVTEFLSIDHMAETMTAIVLEKDSETGKQRADKKLQKMCEEALSEAIKESVCQKEQWPLPDGIIIKESDTLEEYCAKVEKIKDYIREGHVFQTVLSQRWTVQTKESGFTLYQKLREENPSPYMYYFKFDTFEIIGSSPEMLVKRKDGIVSTCPIAGTRPRGKNKEEDETLKNSLCADPKEKAEHVMLVELARNDMGKIACFGSVKVKDFMHVQKYSHVMHLVSFVEGRAHPKYKTVDLLGAFLPAGTLSGAPKVRALAKILVKEELL